MDNTTPAAAERARGLAAALNVACVLAAIGGATLLALATLDFAAYTAFVLRFVR